MQELALELLLRLRSLLVSASWNTVLVCRQASSAMNWKRNDAQVACELVGIFANCARQAPQHLQLLTVVFGRPCAYVVPQASHLVTANLKAFFVGRHLWGLVFVVQTAVAGVFAQNQSQEYEMATIIAVDRHPVSPGDLAVIRYGVSVKNRNTAYVDLFTPANGVQSARYAAGREMLLSVERDALTVVGGLSGTTASPILRVETLPQPPILDWSKLPSQYFAIILQHLSDNLDLSVDQQSQIASIIDQEAREVARVCFRSILTVQDRLNHWEMIVHSSDEKMKAILSQAQWQKLEEMRGVEKQRLKQFLTTQEAQKHHN